MKVITLKTKKIIICIAVLTIFLSAVLIPFFIMNDDKNIEYEDIVLSVTEDTFIGEMRIAHLSDLHFPKIKVNINGLISKLEALELDFVAITGDFIDSTADVEKSGVREFIERLQKVAPIYYVNGNHEKANESSELLYNIIKDNGGYVIDNEVVRFSKGNSVVSIIGLSDNENYDYTMLSEEDRNNYKVLLAHRPEWEKSRTYIACSSSDTRDKIPNLVLSGHAHGGQFRFFGKGLVAPNQGFSPKYDNGLYHLTDSTDMIVSRGMGNSIIPFRLNNLPHVPIITLKKI